MSRRKQKKSRRQATSQARRADRYELYEKSVQDPDADIQLIDRIFRNHFDRRPELLREDFCGTALLARRWVEKRRGNRAWAIDLDPIPLIWGREHHIGLLRPDQAARIKLIEGDVLDIGHEKVDVTVAFNFSYFLFKTRSELRRYFETARATLKNGGLLLLDAYGGADSQRTGEEPRSVGKFTYVWDQYTFDPITDSVRNYIHFKFRDGSELRRSFRYDWRLWTIPELRELLAEAGFCETEVYWEGTDGDSGEGNGIFRLCERAPEDPAWICYITAYR